MRNRSATLACSVDGGFEFPWIKPPTSIFSPASSNHSEHINHTPTMVALNSMLLRRTAVLSSTSRRAFSASTAAYNATPQLKREGPTAHKGDKGKFDDGRKCIASFQFSIRRGADIDCLFCLNAACRNRVG